MSSRQRTAALMLVALAVGFSACGKSEHMAPKMGHLATTTSPVAAVRLAPRRNDGSPVVAEAEAICERIKARHDAVRLATTQDAIREIPAYAVYQREAIAQLTRLRLPGPRAAGWTRLTRVAWVLARHETRVGAYVERGELKAAEHMFAVLDADELSMKAIAHRLGMPGCEHTS